MWDKPFSTEMLVDDAEIAVNCPDEDLERELAAILTAFGRKYPARKSLLKDHPWEMYKGNFCYYVKGSVVRRGPKDSTKEYPWDSYQKCTFYGEQQEDISEESFNRIISHHLQGPRS